MIPYSTLRDAAFWDKAVCLSCGSIQPDDTDPEEHDCLFCGSEKVVSAASAYETFLAVIPPDLEE